MNRRLFCIATLFLLFGTAGAVSAQTERGVRVYEEALRIRMDQKAAAQRELGFDAGGWLNIAFFHYNDPGARRRRTLSQYQARGWASLNYQDVHTAYVRGLLDFSHWADGDNPRHRDRNLDFDESIERAWYQLDLGQLLAGPGKTPDTQMHFKVGRDYMTIGTGLSLSMPLDMLQFQLETSQWRFMGFLGKSLKHSMNIDLSERVDNRQERCFYGFEVTYLGWGQHRPFAYYFSNSDHTSPKWQDSVQGYDYSSRYVGLGSTGSIVPNLNYSAELVGEWGKTYSSGVRYGQDKICAWAFNAELEYLFRMPTHPSVTAEYIFASGDGDRLNSSSTVGGNRPGTRDNAFNGFGYRDTGISFAPQMSNIHIYSLGGRFFPFEKQSWGKKLELGTKVFFYHKDKSHGGVSDPTATVQAGWLGWEWDVYCNWRVTSDLSWQMRYGAFQPGDAYSSSDNECRHFLYTGMSLSF